MINAAVRNSIRGSGRQAYPHQVARALPRAGLLLYLGRPNLEAADVPIGDDMFLLPADTTIRTATGWVSGTVNLFYDADGVPIAVTASEIAAWPNINQWNVLFHLVSADSGRLAIYAADTPIAVLNKALKILRETALDLTPTIFYNGVFTPAQIAAAGGTYTGGPTVFADNLGALQTAPSGTPALQGMRYDGGFYFDTTLDGTPLLPSANQPTRTFDAGFTASNPSATYKKYTRTNPAVDLPGYLCEPARTNYALNSPVPATRTTGSVPVGTYTLWQAGTGSITATAGTAVGTFGAASNGTPATITITTAGTVVLTASGTNTWVQLELGTFATSRITTASAAVTRQGTVLSFPTSGKIRNNDIALKLSAIPRGAGQSGYLWGSYTDASNFSYLSISPYDITFKSVVNGFSQDLAIASYTHKADTPFEVILCKSTRGAQLLVREYSGGTWQPWVRGGFSVTSDNLVLGSTYTLGAFNNAGQFAGNVSELDSLLIPAGIANPVEWVESQWAVNGAGSNPVVFNHTFTGLTLLDGVLQTKSATDSVTINWGDGTSNTYAGTADTAFTHTYASATAVYNVTYTASDSTVLTKIAYTPRAGGKVGGVLSLPASMTTFACAGSNTLSGALSLPASMTYFDCSGFNTLSGALSLPASMTYFYCYGSNTLSGVLSLPASMTYFYCAGSNTLSGALSLPAAMTTFFCYGSNTLSGALSLPAAIKTFSCSGYNTLSGALSLPASMAYFYCYGYNTLSGALSLPAAMTTFDCSGYNTLSGALSLPAAIRTFACSGFNTLSGVLSLPASMTYFNCQGSNTLSGYTPSAKAINQWRFTLTGLNTLSAANVDAIIQDYANAGGTWGVDKVFSLTVLAASNRTAASDAAWATLGTKGLVTRTITLR